MSNKFIRFALIAFIIVVLFYAFYSFYDSLGSQVETVPAVNFTVTDSMPVRALIIRNEYPVLYTPHGVLGYEHKDGEKVSKGNTIAYDYNSVHQIETLKEIKLLKSEIAMLRECQDTTLGYTGSAETLNTQIGNIILSIVNEADRGMLSATQKEELKLVSIINKKLILTNKVTDFNERIDQLNRRVADLEAILSNHAPMPISAEEPGYFVGYSDGLEDELHSGMIKDLTLSGFYNYLETDIRENRSAIGKMILDYRWYAVMVVKSEDLKRFPLNSKVSVNFKFSHSPPVTMQVLDYKKEMTDSQDALLILFCDQVVSELTKLRCPQAEIVLRPISGLLIPENVVQFNNEGQSGVYVIEKEVVKFKEIKSLYHGEGYYISEHLPEEPGFVALYDDMVVGNQNLTAGELLQ